MNGMSLIRRLSHLGTYVHTLLCGKPVGCDSLGNTYYEERRPPKGIKPKRWVMYAGEPEASMVPPEWHGWLHYTFDAPLSEKSPWHRAWQKPHLPNMTGTTAAYVPPGHTLMGGKRAHATGDYEAWRP